MKKKDLRISERDHLKHQKSSKARLKAKSAGQMVYVDEAGSDNRDDSIRVLPLGQHMLLRSTCLSRVRLVTALSSVPPIAGKIGRLPFAATQRLKSYPSGFRKKFNFNLKNGDLADWTPYFHLYHFNTC